MTVLLPIGNEQNLELDLKVLKLRSDQFEYFSKQFYVNSKTTWNSHHDTHHTTREFWPKFYIYPLLHTPWNTSVYLLLNYKCEGLIVYFKKKYILRIQWRHLLILLSNIWLETRSCSQQPHWVYWPLSAAMFNRQFS